MTTLFGLDVAGVVDGIAGSNVTLIAIAFAIVVCLKLVFGGSGRVIDVKSVPVSKPVATQAASQGKAAPAKAGKQLTPYQVARRACVRVETSKFGFAERQAKNDWLDWTYGGQQIVGSFR